MAAAAFRYETTDVPPGVKLDEWRRAGSADGRKQGLLKRLALGLLAAVGRS